MRTLLVAVLVVAAFCEGIHIGRQRQKADDEAAALAAEKSEEAAVRARIIKEELLRQEVRVEQLVTRVNALMAEESRQNRTQADADLQRLLEAAAKE